VGLEGREVHPWFFEEEGGFRPRSIGMGNRCGKKEGQSMVFEEEGGLCPRPRKGITDLGGRKGGSSLVL
jgi:hypothetical protein